MSIFDVRDFTPFTQQDLLLTQLTGKIIAELVKDNFKIDQLRTILEETAAFSHDNNTNLQENIKRALLKFCVDNNLMSSCSMCLSKGYLGHPHFCYS